MPRKGRAPGVREPIQVYLTREDRELLDRASKASGESRAEILRRGMRQHAMDVLGDEHPMLKFLREMNALDWPEEKIPPGVDPQEWFEQELEKSVLDNHDLKE